MPFHPPRPPEEELDLSLRSGRPRNVEAHQKILAATRKLAQSLNYGDITITGISIEAKVAKSTIYRWWPDKAHLVFEAIYDKPWRCPNTGGLETDLEDLLEQYLEMYQGTDFEKVQGGLWADLAEHGIQENTGPSAHLKDFCKLLQTSMDRALGRGEITWRPEASLIQSALMGSVHQSQLNCGMTPRDTQHQRGNLRNLVHILIHGMRTPPPRESR